MLVQYGELEGDLLFCIYVNLGFVLLRALFKVYEMYSYAFYRNDLDYRISYYVIYFLVSMYLFFKSSVWSGYLVYTNVIFYSNFALYQSDSPIFAAMITIIFVGYFVIFETAIVVILVTIIALLLYFSQSNRQVPIENVSSAMSL